MALRKRNRMHPVDQNIQKYPTCEYYTRSSTKLQQLLTCRRKRQMLKKTSNPMPPGAGSGTNKRGFSIKRPHLAPHSEEEESAYNDYNLQADNIRHSNCYHHDEPSIGVRTNKMMKFKHAGFQSELDQITTHFGYQTQHQKYTDHVQQKHVHKQQPQPANLEISPKNSTTISNYNVDNNSKHLVKSISDLPVFVTIEGFRVASYSIGGEPHLCLPQLLQFLKQNFTIKRLIDKFEESVVTFPSATPKQVEGFVKSSVLPPSATSCPLIKRSDADKICLGLYEQCSKASRSDIVKLCSQVTSFGEGSSNKVMEDKLIHKSVSTVTNFQSRNQVVSQVSAIKSEYNINDNQDDSKKNVCVTVDNSSNKRDSICEPSASSCNISLVAGDRINRQVDILNASSADQSYTNQQLQKRSVSIIKGTLDSNATLATNCNDDEDSKQIPSLTNESIEKSCKSDAETTKKPPLFESEAQNSILALARAITSTLIIRVYHKCFGKCLGLYYPSLLINCNSKCIECANCKLMLSPRRFIGHTHGSKERDLCHWGFNSYNWRSYIRLSRKQTQNNLDDDELLIQFKTLLSVSDDAAIEIDNDDYEFDKQETDESYSIYGDRIKEINADQHVNPNKPSYKIPKRKHTMSSSLAPIFPDKNAPNQAIGPTTPAYDCSPAQTAYNLLGEPPFYLPSSDKLDLRFSAKSSLGIPPTPVSLSFTSDDMRPIYAHSQSSLSHQNQQPQPSPSSQQLALHSDAYYSFAWSPLAAQAGPAQSSVFNPSFGMSDLRDQNHQQSSACKRSSSFSTSSASNFWPPARSTSVSGSVAMFNNEHLTRQLSLDSETKREIYICNNLTSYLSNKGLSLGLTNDIVENTLNVVRRSKALF